ncbi:lysoplasmalogenase [Legionella sp. W05-934-2]|uniref:lysoplasmalogenase n=1 Tax=Legionella sp. W05-934-2 TaxID=1198649 RepID=UPI003461D5CC
MTSYQRWGYTSFIVLAIIYLSSFGTWPFPINTLIKPLPIVALLFIVALSTLPSNGKYLLMAALCLSALGDIALTLPLAKQLELGLGSFLFAHVSYIMLYQRILKSPRHAQIKQVSTRLWTSVALIGAALFIVYLWPFLGDKLIPVLVYMAVILTMTLLAMRVHRLCAIGAGLFVISDCLVAMDEFFYHAQMHFFAIMLTYYAAQCCLVVGLLRTLATVQWPQSSEDEMDSALKSA